MGQIAVSKSLPVARLRDLIELGKPRLSTLVLFTAGSGLLAAPTVPSLGRSLVFVFATALLVVAANTLNCWIEREIDGRMHRTCARPLPAGRLEPHVAVTSGALLSVVSLALLAWSSNALTMWLGLAALVSYVAVYTPLKRVTPWSVLVGAVPGALPPLMGWTAATGNFGAGGWYLFGLLFFWQLPHFVAISVYLREDFERGGLRVMSLAYPSRVVRALIFAFSMLLLGWTLAPRFTGLAGNAYVAVAALLGVVGCALAAGGLHPDAGASVARRVFGYSLLHLPLLILAYLVL